MVLTGESMRGSRHWWVYSGVLFCDSMRVVLDSKSAEFEKKFLDMHMGQVLTIGARILDILMLFGVVKWDEIYVTPEGPTRFGQIVSEVIFGMAFTVTALIGSLMLLTYPRDIDPAQVENEFK